MGKMRENGEKKVIGQTRLMDGEEDGIMRIGRKGQERRKVMEKGQRKGDGHIADR